MFRMESNVVLKFFEPLDAFVRIRIFTPEEIERLLSANRISDKRSYLGLVLNACLLHYHDQILPRIDRTLEDKLYALCAEVNPGLDIRRISIPAVEESEIHLLEQPKPTPDLRSIESELGRRVIGQDEAISSVARAIKKGLLGLRDPEKPLSTFLFVGRTGVGKTELAKAITLFLSGRMLRVDCSEFALPHEYAKLIGAPPGYVGHDQPGVLARQQGESVILFDEIEKSDSKVHDLLLQIMDEGFVTDNKGRRLRFDNALIILTTNEGAQEIDRIGFKRGPDRRSIYEEALRDRFRPEFLNRLNEIVLFNPIGLPECERIAGLFLEEVSRHAQHVPLSLHFTNQVPKFLAEKGFNPDFGARELRRTVEREVESPISDMLVDGHLQRGDSVTIRVHRDRLSFHRN